MVPQAAPAAQATAAGVAVGPTPTDEGGAAVERHARRSLPVLDSQKRVRKSGWLPNFLIQVSCCAPTWRERVLPVTPGRKAVQLK